MYKLCNLIIIYDHFEKKTNYLLPSRLCSKDHGICVEQTH